MVGPLKRRNKLAQNAAAHLEPGETVRHTVVVVGGGSDGGLAAGGGLPGLGDPGAIGAGGSGGAGYAAIGTDRNIYVFPIAFWGSVKDPVEKIPIERADVELEKAFLGFRPALRVGDARLTTMLFGKRSAKQLVQFIESRQAAAGSRPPVQA